MHIAVDLKVIEGLAAAVARAAEVQEDRIGWGLVRLWHRTWSDKQLARSRSELTGVFGGKNIDAVISALVDFGFLEVLASGYRVCGARRYLRLKAALSRGGRIAAGNLKRGDEPGSKAGQAPGSQPGVLPGSTTEHRTPNTEEALDPPVLTHAESAAVEQAPIGKEEKWAAVVEQIATHFLVLRDTSGKYSTLPKSRGVDYEALRAWLWLWCRKYEPDARGIDQLERAMVAFLGDEHAPPGRSFSVWCSDNVGMDRWNQQRAKDGDP